MKDGDSNSDRDQKAKATTVKHATFAEPEKQADGSVGDSDDDTNELEVRMPSSQLSRDTFLVHIANTRGHFLLLGDF
ncbi:hypothetical protein J3458_003610 [Metarhizium acridum]|uniref:uncharacterized protein n=1 Tax=Metarhizium acridum TaxID=92637 RepID=UPI001C6BB54E|nr:hypothetical protein J3458_003610 [Metarhizium acridum]